MISQTNRFNIYSSIFEFIITNNICTIPISISKVCSILKIELVKLSTIVDSTTLTKGQIFEIWGNEDGAVMANAFNGEYDYKIAYNDEKPKDRIRFTLSEEICHIVLGHTKNEEFNVFEQSYADDLYLRYDEEARIAAGILICPPQFYYKYQCSMNLTQMCEVCEISYQCAVTRTKVFNSYKRELQSHLLYSELPAVCVNADAIRSKSSYNIKRNPKTGQAVSVSF